MFSLIVPAMSLSFFITDSKADDFFKGKMEGVSVSSEGVIKPSTSTTNVWTSKGRYALTCYEKNGFVYLSTVSPASVLKISLENFKETELISFSNYIGVVAYPLEDGRIITATFPDGEIGLLSNGKYQSIITNLSNDYFFDAVQVGNLVFLASTEPDGVFVFNLKDLTLTNITPKLTSGITALHYDGKFVYAGTETKSILLKINPKTLEWTEVAQLNSGDITSIESWADKIAVAVSGTGKKEQAQQNAKGKQPQTQSAGGRIIILNTEGFPERILPTAGRTPYIVRHTDGNLVVVSSRNDGSLLEKHHLNDGTVEITGWVRFRFPLKFINYSSRDFIVFGETASIFTTVKPLKHIFTSRIMDLKRKVVFGRINIYGINEKNIRIFTRTGNTEKPETGKWSKWSEVKNGKVISPSGRFFQYKLELPQNAIIEKVTVSFNKINSAPIVESVRVDFSGGNSSGNDDIKFKRQITISWSISDDDKKLKADVFVRKEASGVWFKVNKEPVFGKSSIDISPEFLPDGIYRAKVVVDDSPSNPPMSAKKGVGFSTLFTVDSTPPVLKHLLVSSEGNAFIVNAVAEDETSAVVKAEFSVDLKRWYPAGFADGTGDSKKEYISFRIPRGLLRNGENIIAVRVFDASGNFTTKSAVFFVKR